MWSIAEQAYGSGSEYRRLVDANLGRRMSNGQVFSAAGVIQPGWRLLAPGAVAERRLDAKQDWYTVRPDDTLSSIAGAMLGDSERWTDLFAWNAGATSADGQHTLVDPDTIWPGMRLQLAADAEDTDTTVAVDPDEPDNADVSDLLAASAAEPVEESAPAVQPTIEAQQTVESETQVEDPTPPPLPPLLRTPHALLPVVLDNADSSDDLVDATPIATGPSETLSAPMEERLPWYRDPLLLEIGAIGIGITTIAAGLTWQYRRRHRLRPLSNQPESEVVVQGGFAEAEPAHDLTRGLHGTGFDPLAALVAQLHRFIVEYDLPGVEVVAVRHGRSSTTLTLHAGIAEQSVLLDLASAFGQHLNADVEACVSVDQDVLLRLIRVRKTRLLPTADTVQEAACLVPLGVLYDRRVFAAAWQSLGHVLVVSLPGHGADTILTSLVATLTARRSPAQLRVWTFGSARALPAPLFELPHLERVVDPSGSYALAAAIDDLRAELDRRAAGVEALPDLLVVVPELSAVGEQAADLALVAARAAELGVRVVVGCVNPDVAVASPLTSACATRMVLRMQSEDHSVALLGIADAAFLGGGGRLLLRLDGREPVEMYGYQVAAEHLERLVKVMRTAYPTQQPERDTPKPDVGPAVGVEPEAAAEESAVGAGEDRPSPDPSAALVEPAPAAALEVPPVSSAHVPAPPVQVYCFGSSQVLCMGQPVWPHSRGDAKPWELLLFLACQPVEGVSRRGVIEAMWPDDEGLSDDAGHRFRQLRFRLRQQLSTVADGPRTDGVCLQKHTLCLDPGIIYSDAQEFLSLLKSVRINPGDDVVARLERARALYVGDLLDGPDTHRYAWADERDDSGVTLREHFRRLYEHASTRLAEAYVTSGNAEAAVALYRELTDSDPADERLWIALFRLHAEHGDRDALVAEEVRMREVLQNLAEDLDLDAAAGAPGQEPSREAMEEYRRLLAGLRQEALTSV